MSISVISDKVFLGFQITGSPDVPITRFINCQRSSTASMPCSTRELLRADHPAPWSMPSAFING